MSQDDLPPTGGDIRISRDTLLLLGALSFLIIAVALTFFFTPGYVPEAGVQTALDLTATAAGASPYPGGQSPIAGESPYPGEEPPLAGESPYPSGQSPIAGESPYPDPGTAVAGVPPETFPEATATTFSGTENPALTVVGVDATATLPAAGGAPTISAGIPTSDPFDPGQNGAYPEPDQGAYPGPVGDETSPAQPTFNPTVVRQPSGPIQQPPTATFGLPTTAPPPPATPTSQAVNPPAQPAPTQAPPPQTLPTPTSAAPQVPPTSGPEPPVADVNPSPSPTAQPIGPPPPPLAPPADVLRGNVRWSTGQSPIVLSRDVQLAPGTELIIEPGVTVLLRPGVSIYLDNARLLALGLPEQPVHFWGATDARWNGIFAENGSFAVFEHVGISGGGAGGTLIAFEDSELIARQSRITDNGGGILLDDTKLELRNSEIAGNDVPFGSALLATYERGGFFTMAGNRVAGNRISDAAPQVRVINRSTFETVNVALEGNLIRGGVPNLELVTNGPLQGAVVCNTLIGDQQGFGLRTQTEQVAPLGQPPLGLEVAYNIIDQHTPPIIPIYLEYGIGRGAISEVLLEMPNNWWGAPSGPYAPERNPLGRGDSVGVNIIFEPWLTAPPECAAAE